LVIIYNYTEQIILVLESHPESVDVIYKANKLSFNI